MKKWNELTFNKMEYKIERDEEAIWFDNGVIGSFLFDDEGFGIPFESTEEECYKLYLAMKKYYDKEK